jgi:pyrimidine-nucleoside phosphorylase
VVVEVEAPRAGHVMRLGAVQTGAAALHLGAGRRTKDDVIDHSVGIVCRRKRGDEVGAGELLAEVHARDEASAAEAVREVLEAYEIGDEDPPTRSILLDVLSSRSPAPA